MHLLGVDFTSAPTRRKPITVAHGERQGHTLKLVAIESLFDFASFEQQLAPKGWAEPWLGVFDLPFGLPRELVTALAWPTDWPALWQHYASLSRT